MDSYRPDVRLPLNLTGARRRAAGAKLTATNDVDRIGASSSDSLVEVALSETDDRPTRKRGLSQPVRIAARCVECGTILTGRQAKFCCVLCRDKHNRALRPTRYSITRGGRDLRSAPSAAERQVPREDEQSASTGEGRRSSPVGVTAKRK
jgi:hypothetical protein